MFILHRLAVAALLTTLTTLAAGCAASADVPDETLGTDEAALKTGRGPTSGTSATCSAMDCPGDALDTCFVPCVGAGGSVSGCTTACGCTRQTWTCPSKVYTP